MRRLWFLAAAVAALFASLPTLAESPKGRDTKAPPHIIAADIKPMVIPDEPECCGEPPELKPMLGRAIPKAQYDIGRFHAVVGQDGKTRYFARLCQHLDTSKRKAPPPQSIDWSAKAPAVIKRMYLNNKYGCCVISSRYHQLGVMSAADGGPALEADDAEVYATYQVACGRGDNGCDMSAVNQYQQRVGIKVKGVIHKTDGSVRVDNTNQELVKAAIAVFGGANVGMKLPRDWYNSPDGADWGTTNSGIVGGHEVQAFGYDDKGVLISTWGGKRRILWSAFTSNRWIDELYVTLSPDWYGSDKLAPNGISADTLKSDLALISGGQVPPLPDPGPVDPPVTPPTPPKPPVPVGDSWSGTIVVKDGKVVKVIDGGSAADHAVEGDLKAAGVSPIVILDVLKLLADIRAKAGRDVILADVLKIVADLAAAEPQPRKAPTEPHSGWVPTLGSFALAA